MPTAAPVNLREITFETVRAFYLRYGFDETGNLRAYGREVEVAMSL